MRLALAQTAPTLGDPDKNLAVAEREIDAAVAQGADLVVFPELAVHGYALGSVGGDLSVPVSDERLAALSTRGADVVIGFHEDGGTRSYNSAAYLSGGAVTHNHRKLFLPNYLTWEERKHVAPGQTMRAYDNRFGRTATLICNDAWQSVLPWLAVQDGAEVLVVPTNSAAGLNPSLIDPIAYWDELLRFIARMQQCWVVFVNRVGEECGARFWGGSRVIDPTGQVVAAAPSYESALVLAEIDVLESRRTRRAVPLVREARLSLIGREVERLIAQGGDD